MPTRRMIPATKPEQVRPGSQERGRAAVSAQVSVRGEARGSSSREEALVERRFPEGTEAAFVRVGAGMTINTGNFESLRLDVAVTLPCLPEEVEDTYETASNYAADFLAREQAVWVPSKKGR